MISRKIYCLSSSAAAALRLPLLQFLFSLFERVFPFAYTACVLFLLKELKREWLRFMFLKHNVPFWRYAAPWYSLASKVGGSFDGCEMNAPCVSFVDQLCIKMLLVVPSSKHFVNTCKHRRQLLAGKTTLPNDYFTWTNHWKTCMQHSLNLH